MNDDSPKLFGTLEILSAILSPSVKAPAEFKADPKSYLFSRFSYDAGAMEIAVVENSDKVVHLALPCYEAIEAFHSSHLADSDIDDISGGGEIIFSIIAAAAVAVVSTGTIAAVFTIDGGPDSPDSPSNSGK